MHVQPPVLTLRQSLLAAAVNELQQMPVRVNILFGFNLKSQLSVGALVCPARQEGPAHSEGVGRLAVQ